MQAYQRRIANFPIEFRLQEIQASFLGWGAFMIALIAYCITHQQFVSSSSPDFSKSITLTLREWGIWLLITPVALRVLREHGVRPDQRLKTFLLVGVGVLLVSLTFRVGVDGYIGNRDVIASLVIFFPRHLAALVAIILAWYLFFYSKPPTRSASHEFGAETRSLETITVTKGNREHRIEIGRIQWISAAGNYMEICCNNTLYLMRATMKQMEDILPRKHFVRTHRSHIINVNEIERLRSGASGNSVVLLRCGKSFAVSKKNKHAVERCSRA